MLFQELPAINLCECTQCGEDNSVVGSLPFPVHALLETINWLTSDQEAAGVTNVRCDEGFVPFEHGGTSVIYLDGREPGEVKRIFWERNGQCFFSNILLASWAGARPATTTTVRVSNSEELIAALSGVSSNTTIELEDGVYLFDATDASLDVSTLVTIPNNVSNVVITSAPGASPIIDGQWFDPTATTGVWTQNIPDGTWSISTGFVPANTQLLTVGFYETQALTGPLTPQHLPPALDYASLVALPYGYYVDTTSGLMHVKLPLGEDPSNYNFAPTNFGTFLRMHGNRLCVEGVGFRNWGDVVLDLRGSDHVIRDNTFGLSRRQAVRILGVSDRILIEDNVFIGGLDWLTWRALKANNPPTQEQVVNIGLESATGLTISGGTYHIIRNNYFEQVGDAVIHRGFCAEISSNRFFEILDDAINTACSPDATNSVCQGGENERVFIHNNYGEYIHTPISPSPQLSGPTIWVNNSFHESRWDTPEAIPRGSIFPPAGNSVKTSGTSETEVGEVCFIYNTLSEDVFNDNGENAMVGVSKALDSWYFRNNLFEARQSGYGTAPVGGWAGSGSIDTENNYWSIDNNGFVILTSATVLAATVADALTNFGIEQGSVQGPRVVTIGNHAQNSTGLVDETIPGITGHPLFNGVGGDVGANL
jgi:hypothetical protein